MFAHNTKVRTLEVMHRDRKPPHTAALTHTLTARPHTWGSGDHSLSAAPVLYESLTWADAHRLLGRTGLPSAFLCWKTMPPSVMVQVRRSEGS